MTLDPTALQAAVRAMCQHISGRDCRQPGCGCAPGAYQAAATAIAAYLAMLPADPRDAEIARLRVDLARLVEAAQAAWRALDDLGEDADDLGAVLFSILQELRHG